MLDSFVWRKPLSVSERYDVAVFGGGAAGCVAAIQAARAGARTVLVEKNGILGGTAIVAGVNFPGLFHTRQGKQVISGIGWEAIKRVEALGGASLPDFSVEYERRRHSRHHIEVNRFVYSSVLDQMCKESGVHLRLHESAISVEPEDDGCIAILAGISGLEAISAGVVVDASGDGHIAAMMGCPMEQSEQLQPGTLVFYMGGYDVNAIDKQALLERGREALASGEILHTDFPRPASPDVPPYWGVLLHGGGNFNHIPGIDASSSQGKTEAEVRGRESAMRTYRFLRSIPGCEHLYIRELANECGIRDTRRIVGEQRITGDDYQSGRLWPDAVCYSYYPIDIHDSRDNTIHITPLDDGIVPTIPYRALIPRGSQRIIAAGRCISGDAAAHSAYRVQASAMAIGQAAGAAAALAVNRRGLLQQVEIDELRSTLRHHGAIVPKRYSRAASEI